MTGLLLARETPKFHDLGLTPRLLPLLDLSGRPFGSERNPKFHDGQPARLNPPERLANLQGIGIFFGEGAPERQAPDSLPEAFTTGHGSNQGNAILGQVHLPF